MPPPPLPERLQDLPPRWAHFCLGIEKSAEAWLGVALGGKTLLVAVSGGLDSTALLVVGRLLARKNHGRILAAHLDHRLRPESPDDARFVQELCARLDVPCTVEAAHVAAYAEALGLGLEDAGRRLRAAFLARQRQKQGADLILLGHQLDDLAEDVLLRLCRGVGWPGLGGMAGFDPERRILRPFLHTPKAELKAFAEALGLAWREDQSNADRSFARNRLRAEVLPLLLREGPGFLDSVTRLSRLAAIDRGYFDAALAQAGFPASAFPLRRAQNREAPDAGVPAPPPPAPVFLPRERIEPLHPALRLRLYRRVLDSLGPGQVLADSLLLLDQAFAHKRTGCLVQFPGSKAARITALGIDFSRENP